MARRRDPRAAQRFPRTARVNEVIREIVAEALELVSDDDERLQLVSVTGVSTEPDLRRATVFYSARHEEADAALAEQRVRLQGVIARQVHFKRTPQLFFVPDPGVSRGWRIEAILRDLAGEEQEQQGSSEG